MVALVEVLEEARAAGYLGPGDVRAHIEHAEAFLPFVGGASRIADLGTGGGVPGLVLALGHPGARVVLVEAGTRRAAFLTEAVARLRLGDRVEVVAERAEVVGRSPEHRGTCDVVTARAFGPPAVVAECGRPLLRVGGRLVVSEPPDGPDRWPDDALAGLGLVFAERTVAPTLVVLAAVDECPDRYPRRTGVPAKRPLF